MASSPLPASPACQAMFGDVTWPDPAKARRRCIFFQDFLWPLSFFTGILEVCAPVLEAVFERSILDSELGAHTRGTLGSTWDFCWILHAQKGGGVHRGR